jgi:hypothetical protein
MVVDSDTIRSRTQSSIVAVSDAYDDVSRPGWQREREEIAYWPATSAVRTGELVDDGHGFRAKRDRRVTPIARQGACCKPTAASRRALLLVDQLAVARDRRVALLKPVAAEHEVHADQSKAEEAEHEAAAA